MALYVVPLTIKAANKYVADYHRHHKPVQGHKFSIGAIDETGVLRGVAIVGRPVARGSGSPFRVAEVTRLVTDGTENVCSFLYGAAARVTKQMGYEKIQTYILESELGTSLKASNWQFEALTQGRQWKYSGGKERRTDQPTENKQRWALMLNNKRVDGWESLLNEC